MTTTKPIHEILRLSEEEYYNDCFEKYMRWCISNIQRDKTKPVDEPQLQQLVANTAISNWYNAEFSKLQLKFAKMIQNTHQHMEIEQIQHIYVAITSHVYTYYPKTLIDAAKALKIINPLNLN